VCAVENGEVVFVATGICSVTLTAAATSTYAAAAPVTETFAVTASAQSHPVTTDLVNFPNNRTILTPATIRSLNALAARIVTDKDLHITVTGYASSTGPAAHNLALSNARAINVANYLRTELVHLGFKRFTIFTSGKGASGFVTADTKAAENRRVRINAS
jgi:OOP family OmpA-OmpF porin